MDNYYLGTSADTFYPAVRSSYNRQTRQTTSHASVSFWYLLSASDKVALVALKILADWCGITCLKLRGSSPDLALEEASLIYSVFIAVKNSLPVLRNML